MRRARSAAPDFISLAASTAKWGYAVLSVGERGPTSTTEETRGEDWRSVVRAALYSKPASSPPTTIFRGEGGLSEPMVSE